MAYDALFEAVGFERAGEAFYREAAANTSDKFVKGVFSGLADDEALHVQAILAMLEGKAPPGREGVPETGSEGSPEGSPASFQSNSPQRLFGVPLSEWRQRASLSAKQLTPFTIGIELEQKSIDYYRKKLAQSKDKGRNALFSQLLKQEEMHLASLEHAQRFLSDPNSGFLEMERWLLDGG